MISTATLPLFPELPHFGRPDPLAAALKRRSGVDYFDLLSRDILNRIDVPSLPFRWTINPYRGCEFACAYCYARDTHTFFDLDPSDDFETKIFVKRRAADRLRRQLAKTDLRGETIAIGTATDPYQPAEKQFEITRSLLEVFTEVEGLSLSITTKSPLLLRDLELLQRLNRRNAVEIQVTITTVDAPLARRLERHAPDPKSRLLLVERLAEAGISTRVNCMPVLPGINDDEESLAPLFAAAKRAGAEDVVGRPIFLKGGTRTHFFHWLESEFKELLPLYRHLFARRDYLNEPAKDRLMTVFRRLRLEHGFPLTTLGRR